MTELIKEECYLSCKEYQRKHQELLSRITDFLNSLESGKISINDMKHYKLFKEGDKVVITQTHIDDLGKEGVITLVRPSYCKIMIDGKERNHTYSQFKKID